LDMKNPKEHNIKKSRLGISERKFARSQRA